MVEDTVDPMLQVALDSGNVVGSNGARNWCVILLKNTIQFVIMYVNRNTTDMSSTTDAICI